MKNHIFLLFVFLLTTSLVFSQTPITTSASSSTKHGPEKGTLLIIGGGNIPPEIWSKFVTLAGGKEKAKLVVVSAAAGDSEALSPSHVALVKKQTGVDKVTLLHTKNLKEANSEAFIAPLKEATGVFFVGGRQWRIADSYLNTLTHRAFQEVLEKGGVIAGTSAGASIQGSFLWRGDTRGPQILVGDHTQGFSFLKNSAIDQHLLRRNRQFDLIEFIKQSPDLIGLGLDESTAVLVQKDTLEVMGKSYVAIYDYNTIMGQTDKHTSSSNPFFFLSNGQKYDLSSRKVIVENRNR
ncbi:MAG: cyanophycinase [Spirosomataceae bacterium]